MAELPVTMQGTRPMIEARINGKPVKLLADSGASYSILSPSAVSELNLRLEAAPGNLSASGVGGSTELHMVVVKAFELAGATIPNLHFLVTPGPSGDLAGFLGQNFWGLADVEYDLAGGAIRLIKPKDCGDAALAYWAGDKPYSVMTMEPSDGRPRSTIGEAYINGVRMRVKFDTGASTSILTSSAAKRAGVTPESTGAVTGGNIAGFGARMIPSWVGRFDSFKIGDEEIKNARLRFGQAEIHDADMLLGADFLLSHRVYVANSQRKLYFTYNGGPVFDLRAHAADAPSAGAAATQSADEPKDAEGFSRRGAALAARLDYDGAIADFTRAIQLSPNEASYYYQRASARLSNKQPFLAMNDLDQTLKLTPDDVSALIMRAGLRISGQDKTGARADIDAAARNAPKTADVRLRLAFLYQRLDLLDPAVDQYDLWIAAHAGEATMATALNGRCWDKALLGRDLDKALDDCNRALRALPRNPSFLDSRGLTHLRRGEYDLAIADYDLALTQQPKSAWSLYGRGLARLAKGLAADGQADLDAAKAIAPKLPDEAKAHGLAPIAAGSANPPPPAR